ncbi:MAG: T9SS type A sorting domain-containing protein, partial [Chitinophagales bacterium]
QNVDLSNISQAQLSFNVAYAYYSEYYWDGLRVMISTDCGNLWDVVYDKEKDELATAPPTDVPFTPSAQHWRTEVEDLSIYTGFSNVMIKFETVSGHGNNLYIDNVAINDNVGLPSEVHEGADLRLSPNPANEAVNVLFRSIELIENEIRIFNCLGKQIFTTGKQVAIETIIPVKEFAPGSYTVTINAGSERLAAAKLIVFH